MTSAHQITSQKTLARFKTIFNGADAALESISVSLFLLAYTWLYSSEKSDCASGIAAAYQRLFRTHNINTITNVLKKPKNSTDIPEIITHAKVIIKVHIFLERLIRGICAQYAGIAKIAINTYQVIS